MGATRRRAPVRAVGTVAELLEQDIDASKGARNNEDCLETWAKMASLNHRLHGPKGFQEGLLGVVGSIGIRGCIGIAADRDTVCGS